MKRISLFLISAIIFTGLVIFQTKANADDDVTDVTDVNDVTDVTEADDAADTAIDTTGGTTVGTNIPEGDMGVGNKIFHGDTRTFITSNVKIELTETDNIETDRTFYRINDDEEQEYTESFSIEEEGMHTVTYYSVDRLGNREAPGIFSVIVDNTPPDVVLNIMAPFVINEEMVYASEFFNYQYTIRASDSASGLRSVLYSVGDDTVKKYYLQPFFVNSSVPAKINIFAEDKVGNFTKQYATNIYDEDGTLIATSADELVITVDSTPPEVTITADKEFFMKGDLQVASKDYKFTINATDEQSGLRSIYYRLNDDQKFILYTGEEITFSENGLHRIEAVAVDRVGNTSPGTTLEFYVDTIVPTTEMKFGKTDAPSADADLDSDTEVLPE